MAHREEMLNLEVHVKFTTEASVLVVYAGEESWVPRSTLSAVTDRSLENKHGEDVTLRVARWKAERLGWV